MIMEQSAITRKLVDVAMGRIPADMLIRNGRWVCVQSGEIIPGTDIAISDGRIAYVGPQADFTIASQTRIIEANDRYLAPGLLDAHMHVESGMLTVSEFVRAVVPHGTTGMFIDPHEIANVFGLQGVRLMVDEAVRQPVHVWVQMPSCVPSAPGLETPGASIGPEEVAQAMTWPGIVGLGEMMNFRGVINSDERLHAEMAITHEAGKVVGGHYASPDLGRAFHAYAVGGAQDDHEGTRLEDALARVRQGMKAMLRLGSAWHDVDAQLRAVTELGLDARNFILCTDDCHSETLVYEGHINRAVRQAIKRGLRPITAYQMATLNTAEHFNLARQVGQIAPGRFADILLLTDLTEVQPELVIARGQVVAEHGRYLLDRIPFDCPTWATESVKLARSLSAADFRIIVPDRAAKEGELYANIIGVIENQAPTRHLRLPVGVRNGEITANTERDIAKVALVERHRATGKIQVGLVSGFGLAGQCAIGSTVAHDSHHMIVVGTDDANMALAANRLAEIGGGQVVVKDGQVIGEVQLQIAGLMSTSSAEEVARQAATILSGFRSCGCRLNNPNMQLSLLGLVVIPELRISDLGIVDVTRFDFIPLLEDNKPTVYSQ